MTALYNFYNELVGQDCQDQLWDYCLENNICISNSQPTAPWTPWVYAVLSVSHILKNRIGKSGRDSMTWAINQNYTVCSTSGGHGSWRTLGPVII